MDGRSSKAFTLIELLVVISIVALLLMLIPSANRRTKQRAVMVYCMNNLKQIELGLLSWSSEHRDQMPWQIAVTNGGTAELVAQGRVAPQLVALSNYLHDARMYICPADKERQAADYPNLTDAHISYFLNLDAMPTKEPARSMSAGDRNWQVSGRRVSPGLFLVSSNLDISWTTEVHSNRGCIVFADGHVEAILNARMPAVIQNQVFGTNRMLFP